MCVVFALCGDYEGGEGGFKIPVRDEFIVSYFSPLVHVCLFALSGA